MMMGFWICNLQHNAVAETVDVGENGFKQKSRDLFEALRNVITVYRCKDLIVHIDECPCNM